MGGLFALYVIVTFVVGVLYFVWEAFARHGGRKSGWDKGIHRKF